MAKKRPQTKAKRPQLTTEPAPQALMETSGRRCPRALPLRQRPPLQGLSRPGRRARGDRAGAPPLRGPARRGRLGGAARAGPGGHGRTAPEGRPARGRPVGHAGDRAADGLARPAPRRRLGAARPAERHGVRRHQPRPRRHPPARAGRRAGHAGRRPAAPPPTVRDCRICSTPKACSSQLCTRGFEFWVPDSENATPEVTASLERANAAAIPTVKLTGRGRRVLVRDPGQEPPALGHAAPGGAASGRARAAARGGRVEPRRRHPPRGFLPRSRAHRAGLGPAERGRRGATSRSRPPSSPSASRRALATDAPLTAGRAPRARRSHQPPGHAQLTPGCSRVRLTGRSAEPAASEAVTPAHNSRRRKGSPCLDSRDRICEPPISCYRSSSPVAGASPVASNRAFPCPAPNRVRQLIASVNSTVRPPRSCSRSAAAAARARTPPANSATAV